MMTKLVRILILFAVLAVTLFGAVRPASARPIGMPSECLFPWFPRFETIVGAPNPPYFDSFFYNLICVPGFVDSDDVTVEEPGQMDLYDGFVNVSIDGIPGMSFKVFLDQIVPQPVIVPVGWYIYGYGVDVYYNNGNIAPEGLICFTLPKDVLGNFELGVFAYDGQNFTRLSNTNCAGFTGGGSFFLLMKVDPAQFFIGTILDT